MSRAWTKRFPRFLRHDGFRKLFALLLACLLTFIARMNQSEQRDDNFYISNYIVVPMTCVIEKHETDLIFPSKNIPDLIFTVNTQKKLTQKEMKSFYYEYSITRKDYENGGEITIDESRLKSKILGNDAFRVGNVFPEQVILDLDILEKRDSVPVKLMYETSELLDGYELDGQPRLMPNQSVSVSGPKKLLDNLEEIRTKLIPLANVSDSFRCKVMLENPYQGKVSIFPDSVEVNVRLKELEAERFEHVPIQILTSSERKSKTTIVHITPSEVNILSNRGEADKLRKEMLHPFIDISNYEKPGVYEQEIKCWCDLNNIRIRRLSPGKVTITLEEVPAPENETK